MDRTEIHLQLNAYTDLFSDFDPRPYSARGLSDDFLKELKKAVKDAPGPQISLILSLPSSLRKEADEKTIQERLHSHITKHRTRLEKERSDIRKSGIISLGIGILLMFFATLVLVESDNSLWMNFLRILLEPAGWFIAWFGADKLFDVPKRDQAQREFYNKLHRVPIRFVASETPAADGPS